MFADSVFSFRTRHGTVHSPIVNSVKTKSKEEKSLSDKDPSGLYHSGHPVFSGFIGQEVINVLIRMD